MATLLRAHVVVIVTTGSFATTVRAFARQAAESTAVQVVLIDAKTLKRYRDSGVGGLRQELHHFAREALVRKRKQLGEVPHEA